MVRIGVIGLGYWGPNLLRHFDSLPNSNVAAICDFNSKRLNEVGSLYPQAIKTVCADEILTRKVIDAVVIATNTKNHYALAKKALNEKVHVFVEKPLATTTKECEELIQIAHERDIVLFVGHIFLYNSAVLKLKALIKSGDLGKLCYIRSIRSNLGPIRHDINVLWDLAPHDISIILYLMDESPVSVNCQGLAYINKNLHDVCSLEIDFADQSMAFVHTSWIDPHKMRRTTIVGDKKMAVYDDIELLDKLRIYDKGVLPLEYTNNYDEFNFSFRYGDTTIPRLEQIEPLKVECQHFLHCIIHSLKPKTDGQNGLDVVRVLTAASHSLYNSGGKFYLKDF
jgi:predicted dehydrogenase